MQLPPFYSELCFKIVSTQTKQEQGGGEGDCRIPNPGASPGADVPKGRCSGMPASQGKRLLTTGAPGTPAVALEYGPALLYIPLLKNLRRIIYE